MAKSKWAKAQANPKLPRTPPGRPLSFLLGKWKIEIVFPDPEMKALHGKAEFKWLEKDLLLLMKSAGGKGPTAPPKSVSVIGRDYADKEFFMLYSDARRVSRKYEMTLSKTKWTMSRKERGFHQRFTGHISPNRRKITGKWENSKDGRKWAHDFDLVYSR
ncbi:MAG: hypothetical protein V4692_12805 [Bdellovibrionota bacterium]